MKKFKAILILILIFIIIYFLQVNVFTWFNIHGIMPNLFVVFALFMGLFLGKKQGVMISLAMGIILDILVGKSISFSGIFLALISLAGEYFDKNFSKNSRMMIILMTALSTVGYEVCMHVVNILKFHIETVPASLGITIAIETLYNVLLVIIIYPLIQKAGYYLEDVFKSKKYLTGYF